MTAVFTSTTSHSVDNCARWTVTFIVTVALGFTSCSDLGEKTKRNVENTIEAGFNLMWTALADSLKDGKIKFNNLYKTASSKRQDTINKKKIEQVYFSITGTTNFIDSLRNEMSKLVNIETSGADTVRRFFLTNSMGDSLFNRLKSSYGYALDYSQKKEPIKKSFDNVLIGDNVKKFNAHFFSLSNPTMVIMNLYGFEIELLQIGQISFH